MRYNMGEKATWGITSIPICQIYATYMKIVLQ